MGLKIVKIADGYNILGGGKLFWEGQSIRVFDIGDLYITINETSPAEKYGGSWKRVAEGRALFGAGEIEPNGDFPEIDSTTKYTYFAGNQYNAGLPNIKGSIGNFAHYPKNVSSASGALYSGGRTGNAFTGSTSESGLSKIAFDASKSSSLYGNSSTVQPNTYVVYMWEKVA